MRFKTTIFLAIFLLTTLKAFADPLQKFSITCSLFPVYDFAREVAGEFADVKLLLRPGVEPHEFDPSPMDIKALNDSQVFIFTSATMEPWAQKISNSLTNTHTIDASGNIELVSNDPHIWLDLTLAQKMVMNICEGLCKIKPEHSESFKRNAENYCKKLSELDEKFMALNKNKSLVFAGEFAAGYFMRRYDFDYVSAYDGENEPSVRRMAEILKFIREHDTRYIFSGINVTAITRSISGQTGAEILTFNDLELAASDSNFLLVMQDNYEALKVALHE